MALLNPEHGRWLADMQDVFRLAWCTTWMHIANGPIRHRLGLPVPLPVVEFNWGPDADGSSKVPGIAKFVGADPFVWLDDDASGNDRTLLAALPNPHMLIEVYGAKGLQPEHMAAARQWAEQL